jgi:carbon monoxide dehydrogenase subunit G
MHLSGETEIAATRQHVWDTISNPNRVAASNSSGQAQIEKIDERHYKVTVSAPTAMGPMNVVLDLNMTDLDAPSRIAATIEGAIMGGPINGTGSIDLAEIEPKLTGATWVADVTLGGLLGGFEGMMQGPVQNAADQAFASLKERLEAEEVAAGDGSPAS